MGYCKINRTLKTNNDIRKQHNTKISVEGIELENSKRCTYIMYVGSTVTYALSYKKDISVISVRTAKAPRNLNAFEKLWKSRSISLQTIQLLKTNTFSTMLYACEIMV